MRKKLETLFNVVYIGNASLSTANNITNDILKFIGTGFCFAFYFLNPKKAIQETKKSFINTKFDLSIKVWNLLDTRVIKSGYNGVLFAIANISFRKKLFLLKTEKQIDVQYLQRSNEEIKDGKYDRRNQQKIFGMQYIQNPIIDIFENPNVANKNELFLTEGNESLKDRKIIL